MFRCFTSLKPFWSVQEVENWNMLNVGSCTINVFEEFVFCDKFFFDTFLKRDGDQ